MSFIIWGEGRHLIINFTISYFTLGCMLRMETYKVHFRGTDHRQECFAVEVNFAEEEEGNGDQFRSGIQIQPSKRGWRAGGKADDEDRTSAMQCLLKGFGLQSENLEESGKGFNQVCEMSGFQLLLCHSNRHMESGLEVKSVLRDQLGSIYSRTWKK